MSLFQKYSCVLRVSSKSEQELIDTITQINSLLDILGMPSSDSLIASKWLRDNFGILMNPKISIKELGSNVGNSTYRAEIAFETDANIIHERQNQSFFNAIAQKFKDMHQCEMFVVSSQEDSKTLIEEEKKFKIDLSHAKVGEKIENKNFKYDIFRNDYPIQKGTKTEFISLNNSGDNVTAKVSIAMSCKKDIYEVLSEKLDLAVELSIPEKIIDNLKEELLKAIVLNEDSSFLHAYKKYDFMFDFFKKHGITLNYESGNEWAYNVYKNHHIMASIESLIQSPKFLVELKIELERYKLEKSIATKQLVTDIAQYKV